MRGGHIAGSKKCCGIPAYTVATVHPNLDLIPGSNFASIPPRDVALDAPPGPVQNMPSLFL